MQKIKSIKKKIFYINADIVICNVFIICCVILLFQLKFFNFLKFFYKYSIYE